MKITYLHQYFNTPDMAGGTRSYELGRRLVAKGHEVHVITSDRDGKTHGEWRTSNEDGIHVHWISVPYSNRMSFRQRLSAFVTFAAKAAGKARSLDSDVIFATSTPLTIALPGIWASRRTGAPMVFEVRDLWPDVPIVLGMLRNPILKWAAWRLEKSAYRNSAHIVALAPGMRDEIVKKGYPYEQITVIPNGCDVDLFADNEVAAAELRSRHDWLGSRPLLVYAGALGRINAVDYLVEIAARLDELHPEARVVVVGTGIEANAIEARARELDILGKNFFMTGRLPKKLAAVWVKAADIAIALVQGPRFIWKDATQNKYFDALAAATPVASNYDGWQAEMASEAGAAVIFAYDDPDSAAATLAERLNDERWLSGAAVAARELAMGEYSRDRHADELERVLNSVTVR